jgi:hypothetical protein
VKNIEPEKSDRILAQQRACEGSLSPENAIRLGPDSGRERASQPGKCDELVARCERGRRERKYSDTAPAGIAESVSNDSEELVRSGPTDAMCLICYWLKERMKNPDCDTPGARMPFP